MLQVNWLSVGFGVMIYTLIKHVIYSSWPFVIMALFLEHQGAIRYNSLSTSWPNNPLTWPIYLFTNIMLRQRPQHIFDAHTLLVLGGKLKIHAYAELQKLIANSKTLKWQNILEGRSNFKKEEVASNMRWCHGHKIGMPSSNFILGNVMLFNLS